MVLAANLPVAGAPVPSDAFKTDSYTRLLLHFDEAPVKDESGKQVTVNQQGGNVVPNGKFGGALELSEREQLLVVPASVLQPQRGTFEIWIRPRKHAPSQSPFFENNRLSDKGAFFVFGETSIILYYHPEGMDDMVPFIILNVPIPLENWYHVALCWDEDASRIFINGICKAEGAPLEMNNQGEVVIGNLCREGNGDYCFTGLIDELRVSDVVRYKP